MDLDSPSGQVIRLPLRHRALTRPVSLPAPCPGAEILQEALPGHACDASATALILASLAMVHQPLLWVSDRVSRREGGRLYGPGLRGLRFRAPILQVEVSHPRDVLWAMEEGAACSGLAAVVGEIHGAPAALDFTATKRLALRSESSGVPVWLIRSGDSGGLSAARERWRIGALPSAVHPDDPCAPGKAAWDAELFRARGRPPGRWVAQYDPNANDAQDRLRLVSPSGNGSLANVRAAGPDAAG